MGSQWRQFVLENIPRCTADPPSAFLFAVLCTGRRQQRWTLYLCRCALPSSLAITALAVLPHYGGAVLAAVEALEASKRSLSLRVYPENEERLIIIKQNVLPIFWKYIYCSRASTTSVSNACKPSFHRFRLKFVFVCSFSCFFVLPMTGTKQQANSCSWAYTLSRSMFAASHRLFRPFFPCRVLVPRALRRYTSPTPTFTWPWT